MAEKTLNTRIQHKHDTAANWQKATSFVPKEGEIIIYDKDANYSYQRIKIGDGTRTVTALPFVTTSVNGNTGDVRITASSIGAADQSAVSDLQNEVSQLSMLTLSQYFETADYNDLANRPCYEDLTVSSYNISKAPYVGLTEIMDTTAPLRQLPDIPPEALAQVTSGTISIGNPLVGVEETPVEITCEVAGAEAEMYLFNYTVQGLEEIPVYIISTSSDSAANAFGAPKKGTYFIDLPMLLFLQDATEGSIIFNFSTEVTIPGKQLDDSLIPDNIARLDDIPVIEDIEVPVQSVNGKTGEVVLNAADVGALPSTTVIPDALADLTADSTHRTVTDAEKATWNAKSNFSGNYNDLTNKPTIPSIAGLATETYVNNAVSSKVDKVSGKGLSTNDYTTAEKNKLASINVAYGTCSNGSITKKIAYIDNNSNWMLTNGAIVVIKFLTMVDSNATLNINDTGEKDIYYNGKVIGSNFIQPGDIATFVYFDQYHLISIDNTAVINLRNGSSKGSLITAGAGKETSDYIIGVQAFAEGSGTKASGDYSHAEGYQTIVSGPEAHSEGNYTVAEGGAAHAEGDHTLASDFASHAEGSYTVAQGIASHAEGDHTITASTKIRGQHVQGRYNIGPSPFTLHVVGNGSAEDARSNAHTLENDGTAWFSGDVYVGSTSGKNKDEGSLKLATESYVDNLVGNTAVSTQISTAIAGLVDSSPDTLNTLNELAAALGDDPNFATTVATEIGKKVDKTTTVNGKALSSNITLSAADIGVGYAICNTEVGNNKLVATLPGYTLIDGGIVAVKFANDVPYAPYLNINNQGEKAVYHNRDWLRASMIRSGNIATFIYAEGQYNLLSIDNNIGIRITSNDAIIARNAADEDDNYKFGSNAFAHGWSTKASGSRSHAEGYSTTASGTDSHAEGRFTTASGESSHAEGQATKASGSCSHAEGYSTTASGESSHAEGYATTASGESSHAEGYDTTASGAAQHVIGVRNIPDANNRYAYIVGNAKFDIDENNQITNISPARSNAHTLDWDGNAWFSGDVYVGSTSGTNKDNGSKKLATEDYVKEYATAITNAEIDAICGAVIYSGEEVEL